MNLYYSLLWTKLHSLFQFLQFLLCFLCPRSRSRYRVISGHHVSWDSSWLPQISLDLMILIVLGSTGHVSHWDFQKAFSWFDKDRGFWGEGPQRLSAFLITSYQEYTLWTGHHDFLVEDLLAQFLRCKGYPFLPFFGLGKEVTLCHPHLTGGEPYSISSGTEYLCNLFGILHGRFVSSPSLI